MKKFAKVLCAVGLCVAMVLPISAAYTPKRYDPMVDMKNAAVNPVKMVSLPEFRNLSRMAVKSSTATPEADTGALFDTLPDTAATLMRDENGKATISFAGEEKYILRKLVCNKIETAYTLKVYGSMDSTEWVELEVTAEEYDSDKYAVYDVSNKTEYFYYRVDLTADADLTLDTVLPYGRIVKPHEMYWSVFGGGRRPHQPEPDRPDHY